jgi:hypothetical protein
MDTDSQLQQWLEMYVAYHRQVALAGLDEPVGERRETRLVEAIEQCAALYSEPTLADLQRLLDETPEAQRAPWQRLRAWGLMMSMRTAILPHRRALQAQQRSLRCRVDDELIPVASSFAHMASETRRDRRAAIEAAATSQLATLDEFFDAQVGAARDAAARLGYDSLDHLWGNILGVDLEALQDVATTLLAETEVAYTDLLAWASHRRLRLTPAELRRHDMLTLFTFPDYQKYYQPGFIEPALQACLQDMAIDPRADGRLRWRERDATFGPPEALAVAIPHEIVLSYCPSGGLQSAHALAGACGQALLWAYTSEELPHPLRLWGHSAISTGNAQLFTDLVAHPLWLRYHGRLRVDTDYMSWQRLDRLYRFRRQLGRFLFTRHLNTSEALADAPEAYRDIMMEACHIDYAPAYYLVDWDWQYTSLAFWQGWSVAYALLDTLDAYFGQDWFRNPETGPWLCQYWSEALAYDVDGLLQRILGTPWEADLLVAALCDERAG